MLKRYSVIVPFILTILSGVLSVQGNAAISRTENVDFSHVKICDSFWSPRLDDLVSKTIPHCIDQIENQTLRMSNFINAAAGHGEHSGLCYDDSDVYKAMEGMAYSLINNPDSLLEQKVDDWIRNIGNAQWDDGYINTYYTLAAKTPRWTDMALHEMYCGGHLIEAAVAYYYSTGKRTFLDIAIHFADHMMDTFGPNKRHWVTGHEEVELALVRLADATGNKKYTDFAYWLLEERGHGYGSHGNDTPWDAPYCQDEIPVSDLTDISGHAVRAMYLFCGMADVASHKDGTKYMNALKRLWEDVTERNMYVTGGIGSSVKNEGFTEDYDLPNREAYCETCASVALIMWASRMNRLTSDAAYVNVLERTLYNAALAGVQLGGERFFYVNPLESDGSHHRKEWYGTACCPSNISRFLPSLGNYIYNLDQNNIYINLFIGNETTIDIDGVPTHMSISGAYPFDGTVNISIKPEKALHRDVKLRIPDWCKKYTVNVNGDNYKHTIHNGYLSLPLTEDGTAIELNMDMPVEVVAADPRIKENLCKRAVKRGPVVYCMEECDNPDYDAASINNDTAFSVENGEGVLKDFKVIKARSAHKTFTFVPYFAWDNREPGQMKVWVDLQR